MGGSTRKTPIVAHTKAESDKAFKAAEHRRERSAVRVALATEGEMPDRKAYGSEWSAPKDGKQWIGDRHPKLMRK